jgi:mannan endo-1,4-beta-mannosidase
MNLKNLLCTVLLIPIALAFCLSSDAPASDQGFVEANATTFSLNGKPFYYVGINNYYLMVFAASLSLRGYVDEVLADAAAMELNVCRTWAFNDGAGEWNALQLQPGLYDEDVFRGLDYVLYRAGEMGIRLLLPLVNNWDDYGGMNQYVAWDATYGSAPYASAHDDFYTDADTKQWFKDHIFAILNRVNTYNGVTYKDDPTVFAWELANEPRAQSDWTGDKLNGWITEMSAYVKSIDSSHLLTTGEEGFYDEGSGAWYRNGSQGTDFLRNHQLGDIDFCTVHVYPDHWSFDYAASMSWVEEHIQDAHDSVGKPVILEEFGKYRDTSPPVPSPPVLTGGSGFTSTRNTFFQGFFDSVYDNDAAGSNFWILYHDDYPDYDNRGDPVDRSR